MRTREDWREQMRRSRFRLAQFRQIGAGPWLIWAEMRLIDVAAVGAAWPRLGSAVSSAAELWAFRRRTPCS